MKNKKQNKLGDFTTLDIPMFLTSTDRNGNKRIPIHSELGLVYINDHENVHTKR